MSLQPLVLFVASAVATAFFAPIILVTYRRRGFVVKNYRGADLVSPLGLILPLAASVGVLSGLVISQAAAPSPLVQAFVTVLWAFSFLGYLDDRYGDRTVGGFRGHLGELRQGRLTTGIIKAAGGFVAGILACYLLGLPPARILLGAILIGFFGNLINLLDLRPGRALKVFAAVSALMYVLSPSGTAWPLWPAVIPPVLVLFVLDLAEIGMLGDTGSNALGATVGLTFVVNFGWQIQLVAAILLVGLTLLSERYSFSEAIERNLALKWLDGLGRRSTESRGGTRES